MTAANNAVSCNGISLRLQAAVRLATLDRKTLARKQDQAKQEQEERNGAGIDPKPVRHGGCLRRRLHPGGGERPEKIRFRRERYRDQEQARKLVESDEVLLIFQPLGTPSNSAIMKYMNAKKVPQLFVASGGTKFGDPKNFPWTMGFQPNYQSEGRIYAKYIVEHFPDSKIAVFWQNDDAGKDQFKGLKDGLGDKISMIVADKSYEVSDPSIDSQIVACAIRVPISSSPGRRRRDRRRQSARSASSAGSRNSSSPTRPPRWRPC
jgi:hypothetical protein